MIKNLENLGVSNLNKNEMRAIEGGNWLRRIWDWIVDHVRIGVFPSGCTKSF